MIAHIKSRQNFIATLERSVVSYEWTVDSLGGEASSFTVEGDDISPDVTGDWFAWQGYPYLITQVTPGKGSTKLTVAPADAMFDRTMLYDGTTASSIGAWLSAQITSGWKNQTDTMYGFSYLDITNLDSTTFVPPETDDDGLFNLLEYIRMVRRVHGVYIRAGIDWNTLKLTIRNDAMATVPLVQDDGHTQLASSAFSQSSVAKITVYQPVDTGNVDANGDKIFTTTTTNWYLAKDGTFSTTIPANRASGEWIVMKLSETDDQAEKVSEEFAKNGESHKVEFWSDVNLNIQDRFQMNINGEVFEGNIVGKYQKSSDNRIRYKSGELITTLQERARSGAAPATAVKTYAVGDIFTTTRVGNPATLLGYGAWTSISTTTVSGHSVVDWLRKE